MSDITLNEMLNNAILKSFEETFDKSQGIYLNRNTSIFETLTTITAEEASQPSSSNCATIAAHVAHMTYYIEVLIKFINGNQPDTDWDAIWHTVSAVTEEEWQRSQDKLHEAYDQIREIAGAMQWQDERQITGAMGVLMHNAYHLGEIRQMLCQIK